MQVFNVALEVGDSEYSCKQNAYSEIDAAFKAGINVAMKWSMGLPLNKEEDFTHVPGELTGQLKTTGVTKVEAPFSNS